MKTTTVLTLALAIFFSGCAKEIKPWEKGTLAKTTMQKSQINPLLQKFEEHIYVSKEASRGGISVSGGGCGCK
ncbi:DUF4266 domain-containing protein [Sulfurimonas sp.]|nr:DUF4266 domain-containing protein [Sulfurimonas sp.]